MKATQISMAVAVMLLVTTTTLGAERASELKTKADAVRATAGEMNFTKIPWMTSPLRGFEVAKKEKRPVFFYLQTSVTARPARVSMWPGMAGFQQVLTIPRPKYYQSALTANFHEMAFLA